MSATSSAITHSALWSRLGLAHHNWPGRFTLLLATILLLLVTQPIFVGTCARAECRDRDDIAGAAGRALRISLDQNLFRRRAGFAGPFDRMPGGAAVHIQSNGRIGRCDLFVPVPGRHGRRPRVEAVHRKERDARHNQRGDLRLPADGSCVCVRLRSRRTAASRVHSAPRSFKGRQATPRRSWRRCTASSTTASCA